MPQDNSSKIAQQQQQKISGNLKMSKLSTTVSQPGGQGGTSSCSASGASSCHHHYHHHYPPKHRRTGSGKYTEISIKLEFLTLVFRGIFDMTNIGEFYFTQKLTFWGVWNY